MEKLTIGNFTRLGMAGSFQHYFTYLDENGYEVCLESCLNGYDVAIYKDKELLVEKQCTDIDGMLEAQIIPGFSMLGGEALQKALAIANDMYKKFYESEEVNN
jgi:hypothetical protein